MMFAVYVLGIGLLHGLGADTSNDVAIASPPGVCNLLCIIGRKCVSVEPANCVGCKMVPRCVQQECDTSCILPCPCLSRCVLVESDCCPKATCRGVITPLPLG
ncbi:hypothetical protein ANCCAN_25571 [Ancylostoma caninum]|uniref:Trypsin Inhibitor like cysteine rich domain protein n=1 Tax=Ancylostoma caninum TaxID=29170 RepID=A0A368F9E3_ANCCA|nr:hypothetical protein ANCCAN_25571 [Ancylostoma caninum]